MKSALFPLLLITSFFCFSQQWETDFERAYERSITEKKLLLLVFSGSDWCMPCIKLDKQIWQSSYFKTYAEENLVLYKADFPSKKKNRLPVELANANKALAEKYNKQGFFPLVILFDNELQIRNKKGYLNVSPENYIEQLTTFNP